MRRDKGNNKIILEPYRVAYGESGILDYYLDCWNKGCGTDKFDECVLKLIANCCVESGLWSWLRGLISILMPDRSKPGAGACQI